MNRLNGQGKYREKDIVHHIKRGTSYRHLIGIVAGGNRDGDVDESSVGKGTRKPRFPF